MVLFEKPWGPFSLGRFVLSLVEIGPMVLENKSLQISSFYFRYFVIISPGEKE